MLMPHARFGSLAFTNADLGGGERNVVRVTGARIASLGEAARAGDRVIDLDGDRLLPGLINAHDHLALNNLPRVEPPGFYQHAREWIADVDAERRANGP